MMSVNYVWYDDARTMIWMRFVGAWTLDEHLNTHKMMIKAVRAQQHTVDVILDLSQQTQAPRQLFEIRHYTEATCPDNWGYVVVVQPDRFIKTMLRVLKPMMPKTLRHVYEVDTLVAASTFLSRQTDSLCRGA